MKASFSPCRSLMKCSVPLGQTAEGLQVDDLAGGRGNGGDTSRPAAAGTAAVPGWDWVRWAWKALLSDKGSGQGVTPPAAGRAQGTGPPQPSRWGPRWTASVASMLPAQDLMTAGDALFQFPLPGRLPSSGQAPSQTSRLKGTPSGPLARTPSARSSSRAKAALRPRTLAAVPMTPSVPMVRIGS